MHPPFPRTMVKKKGNFRFTIRSIFSIFVVPMRGCTAQACSELSHRAIHAKSDEIKFIPIQLHDVQVVYL